ncbi:Beta-galactosidase-1-like protein [Blomia tropicalis]|nr:Beta-galactosidase-1-like protein [Blomia tropicalis]
MYGLKCLTTSLIIQLFFIVLIESRNFSIDYAHNRFVKDGKPYRYVAGSIHYFRVPNKLWRDRLQKMKFGGLNAISTYVEWSSIEQKPGVFDFSGDNNITHFILEAQQQGLDVILRPGPYICSERDMGGLPYWLLSKNGIKLRSHDRTYLMAVDRYLNVLLPMVKPLLYHNGGPIIMVQVENEYGSYESEKCDTQYTGHLRNQFRKLLGNEIVLYTTDGGTDHHLKCGKIYDVYSTIDFGISDQASVSKYFATQRKHQHRGPLVNSEYYSGWLSYWGQPRTIWAIDLFAATLDMMLSMNASVNIYMYHGGTNFGFTAGANLNSSSTYLPVLTSYDYDAPISEAGDLQPKFFIIKRIIKRYLPIESDSKSFANESLKMILPPIEMAPKATLFDLLPNAIIDEQPKTFEQLDHNQGFMLYSTKLNFEPSQPALLSIPNLHDRAQIFVDRKYVGTLSLTHNVFQLSINAKRNSSIDILVENQGRIFYGRYINQQKGILGSVKVSQNIVKHWKHYPIYSNWSVIIDSLEHQTTMTEQQKSQIPTFFTGSFILPNKPNYPLDSFLNVTGFIKGIAFLNGFNLGRYWPLVGPQKTLYAPSVYFKPYPELNRIVVFETEQNSCFKSESKCSIQFVDQHIIDGDIQESV